MLEPVEPKRAYTFCTLASVAWMLHPIEHGHFRKVERANPIETGDIHAILGRIGPPLVMRIDAAV